MLKLIMKSFVSKFTEREKEKERKREMVTLVNEKTRPDTRQVKLCAGG